MNGFFYIDKASGCTSFDVLRDFRKKFSQKKLGHTGTLDPLATGGLLVATGAYTKLIPYIEKSQKTYIADIYLNGTSPSYDSDTPIEFISQEKLQDFEKNLSLSDIEKLIKNNFLGEISQVPPKYSALKIQGKRALDRILAGEEIEMQARKAYIFSFHILSFAYPLIRAEIRVSAGTYIRSLAYDLGKMIGSGGYIGALRRTHVGPCDITMAKTLQEIEREDTLDPRYILGDDVYDFFDEEIYERLANGQRVRGNFSFPESTDIFLFDGLHIRFVVEYKNHILHPRKKII